VTHILPTPHPTTPLHPTLTSHSYDIPITSSRQPINVTNPIGYYGIFVLNCRGKSYSMLLDVSMTNAGDEGLSCEMIVLPSMSKGRRCVTQHTANL